MKIRKIIIGCKFHGHDSALFAILPEPRRIFAIQTERLTRYKHDHLFPIPALERLLKSEDIDADSVENVVFCHPFENMATVSRLEDEYETTQAFRKHFGATYKKDVDAAFAAFAKKSGLQKLLSLLSSSSGRYLLYQKLRLRLGLVRRRSVSEIALRHVKNFFPNAKIDERFYDHEFCHAACAYVTSPFKDATVISFDGWGDETFSAVYTATPDGLSLVAKSPQKPGPMMSLSGGYPEKEPSIGHIYTYFTAMLGFTPEADEGKVEALAAYGKPVLALLNELIACVTIEKDLSMNIDAAKVSRALEHDRFKKLILTEGRENISATVQKLLEVVSEEYVTKILEKTGVRNLALSGGVAANVINNLLIYEKITPHIHVTPAMADDGSAQGAAYAYLLETKADISWLKGERMPYYETSYTKDDVLDALKQFPELSFEDLGESWPEKTAELLAQGKIGGIFHGRAEWGPRALGNRSLVADPRKKDFRELINKNIKRRPVFQPFCPSILLEEKDRLFEKAYPNKHMTCAFRLKKEFWETLPSAIHVDGTARAQFVEENDNPAYYRLLKHVKELTGFGVVINTSFNKHGRTIVESPSDAIRDFLDTDMDYVVIEGLLITRQATTSLKAS